MLTTSTPTHCIIYGRDVSDVIKDWSINLRGFTQADAEWFVDMIHEKYDRHFPSLSIMLV